MQYGSNVLRVDRGGTLNSVLLHAGFVDEVSVPIYLFIAVGKADPILTDPLKSGIPEFRFSLAIRP